MRGTSLRTRLILLASAFVTLIWFFAIVIVAVNLKWFLDRLIDCGDDDLPALFKEAASDTTGANVPAPQPKAESAG